ncbi:hypothetical protein pb186bvf_014564 [Paramecium bursaria]
MFVLNFVNTLFLQLAVKNILIAVHLVNENEDEDEDNNQHIYFFDINIQISYFMNYQQKDTQEELRNSDSSNYLMSEMKFSLQNFHQQL